MLISNIFCVYIHGLNIIFHIDIYVIDCTANQLFEREYSLIIAEKVFLNKQKEPLGALFIYSAKCLFAIAVLALFKIELYNSTLLTVLVMSFSCSLIIVP